MTRGRPPGSGAGGSRERLRQDQRVAPTLAEIYPQVGQVRVEFDFDDGSGSPPSQQVHSHFPAARSLFRYACPCHSCDGEFDLTPFVADLTGSLARTPKARRVTVVCTGQRPEAEMQRTACPIRATICITATRLAAE